MHPSKCAIIIGNSDGIGLALTQELLKQGWRIKGFSRSPSPVIHESYIHSTISVDDERYAALLSESVKSASPDLCVYCAGIGELLDLNNMQPEVKIFEVNLNGLVKTVSCIIPEMAKAGKGHFIGLSSIADNMLSPEAPSYNASKAGFSSYLESLALAVRKKGVFISNVRFGFVDTKMAKGDVRPFIMPANKAVKHLLKCIEKKPVRYSAPGIMMFLVFLLNMFNRIRVLIN
jgi:short-subunit dehydrogenase